MSSLYSESTFIPQLELRVFFLCIFYVKDTYNAILKCVLCHSLYTAGLDSTVQSSCKDGDVRLQNGSNPLEGRVEVCFNKAWGTICDTSFSTSDATVVCRQLGYRFNGTEVLPISEFSQGSGPIFLDEVACDGDEEQLSECGTAAPGLYTCTHNQDAAIRCIGERCCMECQCLCMPSYSKPSSSQCI